MKVSSFVLVLACCLAALAYPDVIRMEDGTIYLGKVTTASEEGVALATFGKTIRVSPSRIVKTENDYETLRAQSVEVILKDGSVIRGKVKDYDAEIGLFIDLEFGEITIPLESLRSIEDPVQRNRYHGFPVHVGLTGGYYFPVGSLSSSFGASFSASLFAEFNLQILRGLFAGVDVSQFFVNYLPGGSLTYSISTATAGPIYRLFLLRMSGLPFLQHLVPWAGVSAGAAYVAVKDQATVTSYGELDPIYAASLGLDFYFGERLLVRLSGRWLALQQSTTFLHMLSAGIGAAFSF